MPKRKKVVEFAECRDKECWHSYSLQTLTPAKFSIVVGKILKGRYSLINSRVDKRVPLTPFG